MPSGKKDSVAPTLFRTIAASGGEFAHLAVAYLCGSPTWWSPTWRSHTWRFAHLAVRG
jgi:hypothetical protein